MRLSEIFEQKDKTLSLEFFPPKTDKGDGALEKTLVELSTLKPDFISVTYGAGGSTREKTAQIVCSIQDKFNIPAMAHLTCVNATKQEISSLLDEYHQRGIKNILGLRGDPPAGEERFTPVDGGYAYANELLSAIKSDGRFDMACAAYPDGHPEASSVHSDWDRFNDKINAGALCGVTQCFFDADVYSEMLKYCGQSRIIPGIIPVVNFKQIDSFCQRCGAVIPQSMRDLFEPIADDEEKMVEQGLEFTLQLCRDLLKNGAPGLHMYTLNKSQHTKTIVNQLRSESLI